MKILLKINKYLMDLPDRIYFNMLVFSLTLQLLTIILLYIK